VTSQPRFFKRWMMTTMKIEPVLAEVGELLAALTAKLRSATVEEMPALIDEAKDATRTILRCCLVADPSEHLRPDEAAALRAELVKLGEALEAQVAGIINVRWAQLTTGATGAIVTSTRH
jgi:hypothetical protein